ncbi:MAG: helix-turn-helix transcriptional regulator [Planctomycetes bacterium]|nr:helix-turn-helix transcriptional regulator [Planctomycetota bacterium]MBL7039668.1 helix-turn-helix transcriptional regulator [Pirellulaceae bacterium]
MELSKTSEHPKTWTPVPVVHHHQRVVRQANRGGGKEMEAAESDAQRCNGSPSVGPNGVSQRTNGDQRLHRIRTVREEQGMSLRTAARQVGSNVTDAKDQEDETSDLRLSELYRWQAALAVPLSDLLQDPGTPLSRPVLERARMVRVMKTASAILELAPTVRVRRLAQMLVDQLVELMPELEEIGPWHSVGQRRNMDDYGRIVERRVSDELLQTPPLDTAD